VALASVEQHDVGLTWTLDEPMARSSHALLDGEGVWLVDPTDSQPALDRALALGKPAAVLQLLDRHGRACAAIAARLGVAHLRVPDAVAGSPFEVIRVVDNRLWHEVALWWPERAALVVPEAIGTSPAFAPGPAGAGVHVALRLRAPRQLDSYSPEHLLVGHGAALHGPGAAVALHEALDRALRDLPRAVVAVPKALVGPGRR
jgi:hypothetical protein